MCHWTLVSQKASFGGDLLGTHTWWHVQRGDAGEAQPCSVPLSNGVVPARRLDFPSVDKANCHSKMLASLFSAGLEQVSPSQRSKSVRVGRSPGKSLPELVF